LPGTSEHQLGLAVDINADPMKSTAEEVYTWFAENAYQYGFILRYPEGKEAVTGMSYEAWHYRYVGVSAATVIYNEGLCLEEYIGKYVDSNEDTVETVETDEAEE
jgi:D-alanyl-D-alanine carboxypeptidase